MDPDEPTHFDLIVVGTGLTESILSAALSKAGYSVLVLSSFKSYGDDTVASVTLKELSQFAATHADRSMMTWSCRDETVLTKRFEVSLCPAFVKSRGIAIDCAIRSRVAAYLDFGLVGGIAAAADADRTKDEGCWTKVPATKGDVFTNDKLSLIEKRRVTKLLLRLASDEDDHAQNQDVTFAQFLRDETKLSEPTRRLLNAASLSSFPNHETASNALRRLKTFVQSTGVYGPSPFLVGHYGGIGDLVAGYSRVCAVWGGGQILGHRIGPADLSPTSIGSKVKAKPLPFAPTSTSTSTIDEVPAENKDSDEKQLVSASSDSKAIGVPVELDQGVTESMTLFTADYVVCSSGHGKTLFPRARRAEPQIVAWQGIYVFDRKPAFPQSKDDHERDDQEEEDAKMETKVYVIEEGDQTISMVLSGSKTNACPEGYWLVHALLPLPQTAAAASSSVDEATGRLKAAIDALSIGEPLASFTRPLLGSSNNEHEDASLPDNVLVVDEVESYGRTEGLSELIEECTVQARDLFVKLVGSDADFCPSSASSNDDDD